MSSTKVEIAPAVCQALAILPNASEAIGRIYNTDRGRFFSAAMKNPNANDPHFGAGRAEHRINAVKALGILSAGSQEEIRALLRAADRDTYDTILRESKKLSEGQRLFVDDKVKPRATESDDCFYARCLVAIGICSALSVPVQYTQFVADMIAHMMDTKRAVSRKQNRTRDDISVRKMRNAIGAERVNGLTGLYNAATDAQRKQYDHLFALLNAESIDGGLYTDSVLLTPLDASGIMLEGDPFVNAFITILARSIRLDRNTCLSLYNDTRPDRIEAARHEAQAAKESEQSAIHRVHDLEQAVAELERKAESLRAELETHSGDREELAALREAVYNAADDTPPQHSEKQLREIPKNTVVIGGHPSWARQLSDITGVRCYPAGTTCPRSVIDTADEVWIQPSYMGHSEYYAVIDRARANAVTVRYFSTTGITKCVEQITR